MSGLTIPFVGVKRQYDNLRSEILDATDRVLRTGQLMDGNNTIEFEHWLAKRNETSYAITCHSCTQALEIIASWYRKNITDINQPRAIVPTFTFPATANALIRAGWDLYFVDVDRYGLLDFYKIPQGQKFDLVTLVGIFGAAIPKKSLNIPLPWIIEDAAQHWLSDNCQRVATSALSFDPTKNLPNFGNGGAVVTNNRDLRDYAKSWRTHGRPHREVIGSNSRMSEVDCAQMLIKTMYIDEWQKRRAAIAKYWGELFEKASVTTLINKENFKTHSFHKFVIEIDNRDIVKDELHREKIETKIHYERPLHELPIYREFSGPDLLSSASSLSRRVLSLPIYPELTDLEVDYIAERVISCVGRHRAIK